MTCPHPVFISQQALWVPCGSCEICRKNRAREWSIRLMHECYSHEENSFITLTYHDDWLPADLSLDKPELQRFWKRLRKSLGSRRIKYYASGEYGAKFGRPHYHAIVFGLGSCGSCRVCSVYKNVAPRKGTDCYLLERAWPSGFVDSSGVGIESARYVANYVNKGSDARPGCVEPFSVMSQGLGKAYAVKHEEKLYADLAVSVGKAKIAIPRYYKKVYAAQWNYQLEEVVKWYFRVVARRAVSDTEMAYMRTGSGVEPVGSLGYRENGAQRLKNFNAKARNAHDNASVRDTRFVS